MLLIPMAALCTGLFAFTVVLWATGIGGQQSAAATARLTRLASGDEGPRGGGIPAAIIRLRRRGGVSFAGMNLVSTRLVANWQAQLERAGLTLTPREYFIMRVVVGAVLAAITLVASPIPLIALAVAPVGYILPGFWLKFRVNSRRRKLEAQLVEMLPMIASGLRAGFGLQQAMESTAEQIPAPLNTELRRALRDIAMGASIESALSALNTRVGSPDFDIAITAILIQRSVGGNLAEILDNVAGTMRERERIRGEIRTLTAQQRLTGFVIAGIPVGLGAVMMMINPEFMGLLFTEPIGRAMLAGGMVMDLAGLLVIKKIVNIEV